MAPPTTPSPVPHLPLEILLKIFSYLHAEPRIVYISCVKGRLTRDVRFAQSFHSRNTPPLPLYICHHSRSDALSHYKPLFRTPHSDRYTYINFDHDTLRCSDSVLEYLGPKEIQGVTRLELEVRDAAYFAHFNMEVVRKMTSLRQLLLDCKEGNHSWGTSYADGLTRDFEVEKRLNPGWRCPQVRIVSRATGECLKTLEEGALAPGWKPGDEYPAHL